MTITGKYHLTAAQKRHIRALIDQGLTQGQTRNFRYRLTPTKGGFAGRAEKLERDGWTGRAVWVGEPFTVRL